MSFTCQFCKKVDVEEDNMICDECAEKEIAGQERDARYADYYNEQQRVRYDGIQLFDNEVGTVSVVYRRKVIRTLEYSIEPNFFMMTQSEAMHTAKGYIEGWCDAADASRRASR
jgi:hypothetical protein